MHYDPKHRANHAFTLVELLVVLVIITILGALVFAGYSKIVVTSQRSVCASNMRQVWQAALMYVAENKGKLPKDAGYGDYGPRKLNGQFTYGQVGRVAQLLAPYISDQIWYDPDPSVIEYSQQSGSNFGRVWRRRPITGWGSGSPFNRDTEELLVNWDRPASKFVFMCMPLAGEEYPHGGKVNSLTMDGNVVIWTY
jgi:prepilin-type N-terminal cleavage/methylation domain-containing protein